MAIPLLDLHLIEISSILDLHPAESRRTLFAELGKTYCFCCGATRGENGDCPCLIDRRGEIEQQIDNLDMGSLP